MLRSDQIAMLEDLAERLADTFIEEADPNNWTAAGTPMADMTKEQRGNRHWDRKGAMGTGGVLRFTLDVLQKARGSGGGSGDDDEDPELEAMMARAQQQAKDARLKVVGGRDEFLERSGAKAAG